ncbi:MAG: tandem-95 repeat protein [Chloroflexi bacterium]|nr:tandem-95 repeat protein [Chloroflexota bacterium]
MITFNKLGIFPRILCFFVSVVLTVVVTFFIAPPQGSYAQDSNCTGGGRCHGVSSDFTGTSHHLLTSVDNYDCRICHEAEYDGGHKNGLVELTDPDDEGTTYTESSSGAFQPENLTAADIANLTTFCSNCHDSDGAMRMGSAAQDPFDDDADPPGSATSHGNTDFGAAIEGDFETGCIQCHGGHGSDNLSIIQSNVIIAPGLTTAVAFTQLTGTDSFDESDSSDSDDLCAACHESNSNPGAPMENHNGGDHTSAGGSDERDGNCTECHTHDPDSDPGTLDGFMIDPAACAACHVGTVDVVGVGPSDGRPPVLDDFDELTHHVDGTLDDDDCQVCHDAELDGSNHANGRIQLTDPDSETTTFTESSAGAFRSANLTATDLANLTSFCEGCHDDDGATRLGVSAQSPFSGDQAPPAVTTHSNSADVGRAEGPFTQDCAQCHGGHGSSNLAIVKRDIVLVPGTVITPVVFTSLTDSDSFDEIDSADADDLCATCHSNDDNPGFPMADHDGGNHGAGHDERGEDCTTCHPHDQDNDVDTDDGMMPTDGTNCVGCHDTTQNRGDVAGPGGGRPAVEGEFAELSHHASTGVTNADCQICHDAELDGGNHANGRVQLTDSDDPGTTYAESSAGAFRPANLTASDLTNLTYFCESCHDDDGATRLGGSATSPFSSGQAPPAVTTHSNATDVGKAEGPFDQDCAQCHEGHGSSNLALVRREIVVAPGTTVTPVVFTSLTNSDSFDEIDSADADDLCATCHSNTANPGYPMADHDGGNHGTGYDERGEDCTTCHPHDQDGDVDTNDGMMPTGGTNCVGCHDTTQNRGDVAGPAGGRPATEDEFSGRSHHASNGVTNADCQVCHDAELGGGNHANGYVNLTDPDTPATVYAETNPGTFRPGSITAADITTLTTFCTNCHDGDGANGDTTPFSGGAPATTVSTHANVDFGGAVEESFQNGCAQCHEGHGSDNLSIIRPTIVVVPGTTTGPVVFTSLTGANSFDESDSDDTDDLCATCHTNPRNPGYTMTSHAGGDHTPAGGSDDRGGNCSSCHFHDIDGDSSTHDGFAHISAPEMDVWGNGQAIADGDTTPNTTDHTDFGSVVSDGGTVTRTFTISNTGSGALNLTSTHWVTITGQAADFSVVTGPDTPIAAAGSTIFRVRFAPTSLGLQSATITIANNDVNENPYEFAIQGTGMLLTSDLVLTKTVNAETVNPGQTITYTLSFANVGVGTASNVVITDRVPISQFSTFGVVSSSGAAIATTGNISYVWEVENLSAWEWGVITMTGVLSDPLAAGPFTNAAVITTTTSDIAPENNDSAVDVTVQNVAPIAGDDSGYITDEDTSITLNILKNDTDANGDVLSVVAVGVPIHGSVIVSGTTQIVYTPTNRMATYDGVFTYTVSDGSLGDTATVTISVDADNDPPVADDDTASTDEDIDALGMISATAPDTNDTLSYGITAPPVHGSAAVDLSTGAWTYTPLNRMESYTVTFTVIVTDTGSLTDTATVTVTVDADNDPPVADDDTSSTNEDTDALGTISAIAPEVNDTLSYGITTQPVYGSANIDPSTGAWTYTPVNQTEDYTVTFTVTVTDTGSLTDTAIVTVIVTADNAPPVANDATGNTNEDTDATGTISASDSDTNDILSYGVTAQPVYGSAAINPSTGAWSFTPANQTTSYTVTFTVTVTDTGNMIDTATVTITVTADNDPPLAYDDAGSTDEDTDALGMISASDSDTNDALSYGVTAQPAHGSAVINLSTGAWTYIPVNQSANYTVTFTVIVTDTGGLTDTAAVTVTVTSDNDLPVADDDPFTVDEDSSGNTLDVLSGDTDMDSDMLTISAIGTPNNAGTIVNGNIVITYTPATDFFGTETFTYTVSDGDGGYDTATIIITVNDINDAPVAVDDAYNTTKDMSLTVVVPGVLDNDSDIDADSLEAVLDGAPANGTLKLNADGSFIYTPTLGFSGLDAFTYHSHDGTVDSNVVTVEIVVNEPSGYTVFLPLVFNNHTLSRSPNDPDYDYQWAWETIKAPAAWGYSRGENVLIAIVDTGTDLDHSDLADKVRTDIDYDFVNDDDEADDDHGHGTHVSGIAAAATNNGIGVAGMGWGAMVLPLKIISQDNDGDTVDLVTAIYYASDNGADVINMSVGGTTDPCCNCPASVQAAVDYAYEKGVILVAAAGNSGSSAEMFPANCEHVLGVAATNRNDSRASMSNYGNHVSVAAPGLGIYSTGRNDLYYSDSGTSTATPYVAGMAALLIARYPSYTPNEIASAILDNADDLGPTGWDPYYGCGRINAHQSLFQGKQNNFSICLQGIVPWVADDTELAIETTAPFVPGEIIVFFQPEAEIENTVRQYEPNVEFLPEIGAWRLFVPSGQEQAVLDRLRATPTVTRAEFNYVVSIQ